MSDYAYMFQKKTVIKNESYWESAFTAILTIVAFAMISGIIYLIPHALK